MKATKPVYGAVQATAMMIVAWLAQFLGRPGAALVCAAAAFGWNVNWRRRKYRKMANWRRIRHHDVVLAADVLSLGFLVSFVERFLNATNVPGYNHRDAILAHVMSWEQEQGRYPSIVAACTGRTKLFWVLARMTWVSWAQHALAFAFPSAMIAGSALALIHARSVSATHGPASYVLIAASCSITMFLSGAFHYAKRAEAHQASMTATGLLLVALSWNLWYLGVTFHSPIPSWLGLVAGVVFGGALIAWQTLASRDPSGDGKGCRVAAGTTAVFGLGLIGLNIVERLSYQEFTAASIASLWPLLVVLAATLAAASPKDYGVGSRRGAVEGDEPGEEPDDSPDGEASAA